ncbi:hypothetical protein [Lentzea terrae]|uniref:hypothetical protein n=1 Tax=Lentzea terrae TaxID=2200761 RepID=UPI000DD4B06F|nr:hypothetical protein [Lentzea terrae]
MSDDYPRSDNSSHHDSFSPRDGFYDGTPNDAHDLFPAHGLSHDGTADDADDVFHDSAIPRRRSGRHGRAGLSGAPGWVKAFVSLGSLLAVAGMAVIFLSVLGVLDTAPPISGSAGFPPMEGLSLELSPDVKLGFGLFVAGFVLNAIGAIAQGIWSRR